MGGAPPRQVWGLYEVQEREPPNNPELTDSTISLAALPLRRGARSQEEREEDIVDGEAETDEAGNVVAASGRCSAPDAIGSVPPKPSLHYVRMDGGEAHAKEAHAREKAFRRRSHPLHGDHGKW